jgi:hypothetical protein
MELEDKCSSSGVFTKIASHFIILCGGTEET